MKFIGSSALIIVCAVTLDLEQRTPITIDNEQMFQELVNNSDKTWMVNFCFSSCPHCVHIAPVFLDFVASHSDRHDIEIGMIDCVGNEVFCYKFPRAQCPSLLVFKDHKEPYKYTECPYDRDWTLADLNSCLALQVDSKDDQANQGYVIGAPWPADSQKSQTFLMQIEKSNMIYL